MPSTRGKTGENPPRADVEEDEDITLISFFDLYQGFVAATADLLKDEIENIKKRKIARNEAVLKNEKKPEAVRLSKNIVTGFNDAIGKAVKDLHKYSCEMSEDLQRRYNLSDDWMQTSSTTVSVAGSEINGPTTCRPRREIDRLEFFFNDASRSSNVSDKSNDKFAPTDSNNEPQELPRGRENDDSEEEGHASGKESKDTKSNEKLLSNKNETLVNESSTSKLTPKKKPTTDTSDHDIDEDVDMILGSEEETEDNCQSKEVYSSSSKSARKKMKVKQEKEKNVQFETPKKSTASDSADNSKKKETPSKNMSSSLFEDSDTGSDVSGTTCIVPTHKNSSPVKTENATRNKDRQCDENEHKAKTPRKVTSNSSDNLSDASTPKKPASAKKESRDERKSAHSSPLKKSLEEKDRKSEGSDSSSAAKTKTAKSNNLSVVDTATSKKSVKVKTEPRDERNSVEVAMDVDNDFQNDQLDENSAVSGDNDIMDVLPSPIEESTSGFGIDLDDTMTVMVPRTPIKSRNHAPDRSGNENSDNDEGNESENKLKSDVDDDKTKKLKEENKSALNEKVSRGAKSRKKKSREEREAMRDILDSSSSDSDSETSSKKKSAISRKKEKNRTKKDESESESKANNSLSASKSWKDDPKLKKGSARVLVEKLPPSVEKSLAEEGYVVLKGYGKLKKCSLQDLLKTDQNSGSESDSSTASNDSVKRMEREIKKISRNSIIRTLKHNKKTGKKDCSEKRTRKKKQAAKGEPEIELESSNSDSSCKLDERKCELNSEDVPKKIDDDIKSCSGSEDIIDSDSDNKTKKRERPTRSNASRKPGKTYKTISLSSSGSEKEHMKAVLGSDESDSGNTKKRKSEKKKASESSDSDFEFKTVKRNIKKKANNSDSGSLKTIGSSSDSDSDSDFKKSKKSSKRRRDSSSDNKKRKKRRKRIVNNDSDDSEKRASSDSDIKEVSQDEDEPSTSQKGRKNIRKIMSNKSLAKTTKEAEREEEERRRRLTEKQNLFNGIHKAPESDKIDRLILDVDPDTNDPVIEVDTEIVRRLKPHQAEGIKFMYNACFESVEMIKKNKVPGGCILAHCMGLGKTLQSIAFVHTLLTNELCGIKTALVVCPLSTVNNWFNEIRTWTEEATTLKIHKLYEAKNTAASRTDYLKTWFRRGGVGIMHYDLFRRLADPKGKSKMKPSFKAVIQETLLDPGPDVVICDEGHLLKNCKSMLSLAVNNIKTHRRIVLTGTPLQNNLVEYHTMMNFVKPNLLGSLQEFTNRFVNPIKNGQHADSTDSDVKTMKRRAHVLHRKLEGCVQRCDYSILAPYLPPKYEYIINIKLSDKQQTLYKHYLNNVVDSDLQARRRHLLKYYAELVKVWSHPIALTMRRSNKDDDETSEDDSMKDFICDDESSKSSNSEAETGEDGSSDGQTKKSKRRTRTQAALDPEPEKAQPSLEEALQGRGWWNAVFKAKSEMEDLEISGKLVILKEILKTCEAIGDRVLVFSQFLTSLDIIEEFIQDWDQEAANAKKDELTFPLTSSAQDGRWRRNIEYFRIDGQTKVQDRQRDCDKFNKKSSLSKAKLFLISTRAGGLGINLYGANRVVIFDASWNPSQDMQSIFRVYRFGQDKPCYIYRLIAQGTMEEKILRRQITKLSLSSRVVDEHQIERHFKFDDVNEMYVYDEEKLSTDTVLAVPKDRLLADLLMSHREWITGYEEFDSLLENKTDEGLTNEEKEMAWEEYRIESERRHTNPTSATSEAETYVKVKTRLAANHPHATEQQIDTATRTALQVIEQIRRLMMIQNSYHTSRTPGTPAILDEQLNPLKLWLQTAVSPHTPSPPMTGDSILPPLPPVLFSTFGDMSQQFMQQIRPPAPRRPMNNYGYPQGPPTVSQLIQMQHMSNNFRNIASSTVTGEKTFPSMHHN